MRWLRSLWFQSFRTKLMVVSVLCILLPALVTMVVYNYLTRDAVREQAASNAQQTLQLVNGHVTNALNHMMYLCNYIQVDQDMLMALKQIGTGRYTTDNVLYEEYQARRQVTNTIDSLTYAGDQSFYTIVLNDALFMMNYQIADFDPRNLLKEPWIDSVKGLSGFQSYWAGTSPTAFQAFRKISPYQLTVGRKLPEGINGYVVVSILESDIHKYFRNLPPGHEMMLVDGTGRIVSHVDPGRIGQPFTLLQQAGTSRSNIVTMQDKEYLLSVSDIRVNSWKLVSLTPYKSAIAKINAIFQNVFTFQLISFALFFGLLLLALRAFTSPLVKLDKVAVAVQKGNLEVRSSIRGQDEIGRLGKSFDQMLDRISDMIVQVTATQARKRKAELDMLQAQINPHFLFNVLNSIRMKVLGRGDRESADMISSLSKLLRMTIQDNGTISLHEEVEIVADYVKLMNMRQKEKVSLQLDIAADVFLERVPRFFLQPIIENALIHGLSQQAGTILLEASAEGGTIRIRVKDDGRGMEENELARLQARLARYSHGDEQPQTPGRGFSGIGLANVYERMRMTFGHHFRMVLASEPGAGTEITLYFPKQEESAHV
ncbi:cache domain-containing sensor histidine kinase [Paenibacillus puerhi]|uniref:cache domain-containing sensor histidine kinase n=1 Tax=Paenibacillus puerhi TaxID=2692622 RepID=UPI0013587615|nr:histidine kinase [Paenibacillus puerhi]